MTFHLTSKAVFYKKTRTLRLQTASFSVKLFIVDPLFFSHMLYDIEESPRSNLDVLLVFGKPIPILKILFAIPLHVLPPPHPPYSCSIVRFTTSPTSPPPHPPSPPPQLATELLFLLLLITPLKQLHEWVGIGVTSTAAASAAAPRKVQQPMYFLNIFTIFLFNI